MSCARTAGMEVSNMWRHTKEAREHVAQYGAQIGLEESLPIGVNSDSAPQAPPSVCMMSTEAGAKRAGPPDLLRFCDVHRGLRTAACLQMGRLRRMCQGGGEVRCGLYVSCAASHVASDVALERLNDKGAWRLLDTTASQAAEGLEAVQYSPGFLGSSID